MKKTAEIAFYSSEKFNKSFFDKSSAARDSAAGFKIYKLEEMLPYIKFPLPVHRNNYYEILLVTAGAEAIRHKGVREYRIGPGQVYFKAPQQITSGDITGTDTRGYICLIDKNFVTANQPGALNLLELPLFKNYENSLLSLTPQQSAQAAKTLETIAQKWSGPLKSKGKIVMGYLAAFLYELDEISAAKPVPASGHKSPGEGLTVKFLDGVAANFLEKRKVKDYADILFVTPNHLNKVVKQHTGKPASLFIREMLLLEAQVLLNQTEKNVSEIALQLNFEDASYFIRFFRKHTGKTPASIRKMHEPSYS